MTLPIFENWIFIALGFLRWGWTRSLLAVVLTLDIILLLSEFLDFWCFFLRVADHLPGRGAAVTVFASLAFS